MPKMNTEYRKGNNNDDNLTPYILKISTFHPSPLLTILEMIVYNLS